MNRGLIGFLVFLGVVVLGLSVAAYVLGPNVLSFLFHADRRTEPVVIIDLLEFADAEHEQRYLGAYKRPATALIRALGGRTLWTASIGEVVAGATSDVWSVVDLVAYPSRAAFIELATSSDYRALRDAHDAALERGAVLAATPAFDFDVQGTNAQILRMLTGAGPDSIDVYETKWQGQDEQTLQRYGGRTIWRARLNPLAADAQARFDEILIYGFGTTQQRDAWVADAERRTLQTLQRRLFRRDVVTFVEAMDDPDVQPIEPPDAPGSQAPQDPATLSPDALPGDAVDANSSTHAP